MYTNSELLTELDYYPHKYVAFDNPSLCSSQIKECLDDYISSGKSTASFELEKYIIFDKILFVGYILKKYLKDINNWDHYFITVILNRCDNSLLVLLIEAYYQQNSEHYKPNNELLWILFVTKSVTAILILNKYNIFPEHLIDMLMTDEIPDLVKSVDKWDKTDPKNPRNLVWALQKGDGELALQLVQNGCEVDIWNNYPISICVRNENLKRHKITGVLLKMGARLPKYLKKYYEVRKQIDDLTPYEKELLKIKNKDMSNLVSDSRNSSKK